MQQRYNKAKLWLDPSLLPQVPKRERSRSRIARRNWRIARWMPKVRIDADLTNLERRIGSIRILRDPLRWNLSSV